MTRSRGRLTVLLLLAALLGSACSSNVTVGGVAAEPAESRAESVDAAPSTAAETESAAPKTQDQEQAAPAAAPVALDNSPLDFDVISAGVSYTATTPIPCQMAGPMVDAFAQNRGLTLKRVSGNNCEWSEGRVNSISIHFRDTAEIDVAERRERHGAYDTVVPQDGPGTDAASYLDDNGITERYFFVAGSRAVFLVAETNPPVTDGELRAMADEISGLIGSAVDEGQFWDAAGEAGEDPLCDVWSPDALAQMFEATAVFPGSSNGCQWWMEAANNQGHMLTLSVDLFDSIEIYTRNGGSPVSIGDAAAGLSQEGVHGTLRQIAFRVGDNAMTVTVDSPTDPELADVLAANVAARLG